MATILKSEKTKQFIVPTLNVPLLAEEPTMGWSAWGAYGSLCTEQNVKDTADAFISEGLDKLGYNYLFLDDGWQAETRESDGTLNANVSKYPNGIKALADYVHSKGLKLGIYTSPGPTTCAGYIGTQGYEEKDVETWVSWGIDAVKYDKCSSKENDMIAYTRMAELLVKCGRPIMLYMCQYGGLASWKWGGKIAQQWRISSDSNGTWDEVSGSWGEGIVQHYEIGLTYSKYNRSNGWNNLDMMSISPSNKQINIDEKKSQFSLWCILNAPLIEGGQVDKLDEETRNILKNKYAIAVNKDKFFMPAKRAFKDDNKDVITKEVTDGIVILIVNLSSDSIEYNGDFSEYTKIANTYPNAHIYDIWDNNRDLGIIGTNITKTINSHGCIMVRIVE